MKNRLTLIRENGLIKPIYPKQPIKFIRPQPKMDINDLLLGILGVAMIGAVAIIILAACGAL